MAEWSMEAGAAWVPCDFQLANWTMEEPAPTVWAPGFPVEYTSTEISGSSLQSSSVLNSSNRGQLAEYAAATQDGNLIEKAAQEFKVDIHDMEMLIQNPMPVFEGTAKEVYGDINRVENMIHRCPTVIAALEKKYTVPTMVAMGPYHHGQGKLQQAEKYKHAAAYHCIQESGNSVQEIYDEVDSAARNSAVRRLYDMEVGEDDFLPMMFCDACFLVQYMVWANEDGFVDMDPSLSRFFCSNDNRYDPPHFLGLLRYYIVGRSNTKWPNLDSPSISFSVNAIELAEIGISLTPQKTTDLSQMSIKQGKVFAKLSMPPLSLNELRASLLVNMAAHELCTTLDVMKAPHEDSAVCSYLRHFTMFVDKEEDVHELRKRRLLQGGGGLTVTEALEFFTRLQSLRLGKTYYNIMIDIENYKTNKKKRTKLRAFFVRNKKTIFTVCSAVVAFVGILGTLKSLQPA